MRRIALLSLVAWTLTGCFEEEAPPPPPPAAPAPEPTKTPAETAVAKTEVSTDPPPVEPAPPPTPAPEPTRKPKPRKPMDLLSRTAGKVKLEAVDEAALKKAPRRVENRTAAAERRARSQSGKSAWKPRTKRAERPARIPAATGPLEKVLPTGEGRDILRTWNSARRLLQSGSWAGYLKLHTPEAQRAMLAWAIQRSFSATLQGSGLFAQRGKEPPKYRQARERLQRYGVRARTLKLTTTGTGRQMQFRPPDVAAVVAQIRNVSNCYVDLMSIRTIAGGDGTHRGLYWPGTPAGLVVKGDRARVSLIEADGQVRMDVFFRRSGREWKLAARNQTQYKGR